MPEFGPPASVVVVCRRCSYDLRRLSRDGRCPECGSPIVHSFMWDNLYCSDPLWVGSLARGATLLAIAFLAAAFAAASQTRFLRPTKWAVLGLVLCPTAYVLLLAGARLITRPEPGDLPDAARARRIRLMWPGLIGAPLVPYVLDRLPGSAFVSGPAFVLAESACVLADGALIACLVVLLGDLQSLVDRSSHPVGLRDGRRSALKGLAWGAFMPSLVRCAVAFALRFATLSPEARRAIPAFEVLVLLYFPMICLAVAGSFVLAARTFRRDARSAERNWSSADRA